MKKENRLTYFLVGLIVVLVFLIGCFATGFFGKNEKSVSLENTDDVINKTPIVTSVITPEATPVLTPTPVPTPEIKTAKISAMGDLLMHLPVINAYKTDEGYNFDEMFKYIEPYISSSDFAVANLETTLRGLEDGYEYMGYPTFNCPDEIVEGAKNAGFDMLLTGNNHSYDTRLKGMQRTLEVIDEAGIKRLGVTKNTDEKNYAVVDINGIKIGMISYTYETDNSKKVALNGIPLNEEATKLVNAFSYGELDSFYSKIEGEINEMKKDGAEAFVLFIHWGDEYQVKQNKNQEKIAQKMCDLAFDVIVGGHPHVVQPVELLTSKVDESHKTVCLYSMGNAVSNQRRANMNLKTGHTEDGVIFNFSFTKVDDVVSVSDIEIIPTWVNKTSTDYFIMPIESIETISGQGESLEKSLTESFNRTDKIISAGLSEIKEELGKVA